MPSADRKQKRPDLGLPGPQLCVAYANSALPVPVHKRRPRTRKQQPDVKDYDSLLDWGVWAGALDGPTAKQMRDAARGRDDEASTAFAEALRLRSFLLGACKAMARGHQPSPEDAVTLRDYLDGFRLVAVPDPKGDAFLPQVETGGGLRHLTSLIAGSALRMITAGKPLKIHPCSGKGCRQLVLSTSGHLRQWCEMGLCADRAKARRYGRAAGVRL